MHIKVRVIHSRGSEKRRTGPRTAVVVPELTGTSSMLYAFHGAGMRKTISSWQVEYAPDRPAHCGGCLS